MLTTAIRLSFSGLISKAMGQNVSIRSVNAVGGGSINAAYKVVTDAGLFFIKMNSSKNYPGLFVLEAAGLKLLRQMNGPKVPHVIGTGEADDLSFLVLEYLEPGVRQMNRSEILGQQLANLHRNQATTFGLNYNNYIGSLQQLNTQTTNGVEFFIRERIMPLSEKALHEGLLDASDMNKLEKLYKKQPQLLPQEPPSLLHGDLWSGNYITGPDGYEWFIDPAVYYGHRETDIAMTKLFGGFDKGFYASYHEAYPMMNGWEERIPLFQLYPLLVHVNLFGGGYVQQARSVIRMYA